MKIQLSTVRVTVDEQGVEWRRVSGYLLKEEDLVDKAFHAERALSMLERAVAPDKIRHFYDNEMRNELTKAMVAYRYGD